MKLNCLSCGHTVNLDDAYGEYSGDVKCFVCGSLLEVVIEHEHIKSVKLTAGGAEPRSTR
jgi:DNA-directed RNA polymerase subunit N (RpoN/RPB10)